MCLAGRDLIEANAKNGESKADGNGRQSEMLASGGSDKHVERQLREQLKSIDVTIVGTVAPKTNNEFFHLIQKQVTSCTQVFASKSGSTETTTARMIGRVSEMLV